MLLKSPAARVEADGGNPRGLTQDQDRIVSVLRIESV